VSKDQFNRRIIQILGIRQPRCAERHGVAPCEATGVECHNTFATCTFRSAYRREGAIEWMFAKPGDPFPWTGAQDGEHIRTNCLPVLRSVSVISSTINVATSRIGESPFGVVGSLSFEIDDLPWRNEFGDFYRDDRAQIIEAPFWALWKARIGEAVTQCQVFLYTGYEGQTLDQFQRQRYDLRTVNGPSNGSVKGEADSPLRKLGRRYAQFPRATDIQLINPLDTSSLAVRVRVQSEADLDDDFGNTAPRKFLRIGSEVVQYTGFDEVDAPVYDLTGVQRGAIGTQPQEHRADAACQRHGRFERIRGYEAVRYLIRDHTVIDNDLIDDAQWDAEGSTFLGTIQLTGDVPEPTPVESLAGELARDGLFNIWWDDREQTIPLLANRPPTEVPFFVSDDYNIVANGSALMTDTEARITRARLSYGKIDPLAGDDFVNFDFERIRISVDGELPDFADGSIRESRIVSRWIRTVANAILVNASILQRYRFSPDYMLIDLDAKDRDAVLLGGVVDLETKDVITSEGEKDVQRWQVISWTEIEPGHKFRVKLQSYFFVGRFARIMPNSAPDYETATQAERDTGGFIADNVTGLMPNGDPPYLLW
jgi:hypothetical protein